MSAAAKRHMGRVAGIGCIACICLGYGPSPAHVHHIREGRIARNDYLTIPLCPEHHTGTHQSVHMRKDELLRAIGVQSEFDLLAMVTGILAGERTPYGVPS